MVDQLSTKLDAISELTVRIRTRIDRVHQLHIADIIKIYLVFKDDHQPFPIELHTENCRREGELAYRGISFGVGDNETAGRKDERNK